MKNIDSLAAVLTEEALAVVGVMREHGYSPNRVLAVLASAIAAVALQTKEPSLMADTVNHLAESSIRAVIREDFIAKHRVH